MKAASRLHIDPALPFEGSDAYEGKDDSVRRRSSGLKQQRVQSLVCVWGGVGVFSHGCMCAFACVCACVCVHIYMCGGGARARMWACLCICVRVRAWVRAVWVRVSVHVCACVYVQMYVCLSVPVCAYL